MSENVLIAYVGLEISSLLNAQNDLSEYLCTNMLQGNTDFCEVISKDTFTSIGSSLRFCRSYGHCSATKEPL